MHKTNIHTLCAVWHTLQTRACAHCNHVPAHISNTCLRTLQARACARCKHMPAHIANTRLRCGGAVAAPVQLVLALNKVGVQAAKQLGPLIRVHIVYDPSRRGVGARAGIQIVWGQGTCVCVERAWRSHGPPATLGEPCCSKASPKLSSRMPGGTACNVAKLLPNPPNHRGPATR